MGQLAVRMITGEEIACFEQDGAVVLRGLFEVSWIERLRRAIERLRDRPGPLGEVYDTAGGRRALLRGSLHVDL